MRTTMVNNPYVKLAKPKNNNPYVTVDFYKDEKDIGPKVETMTEERLKTILIELLGAYSNLDSLSTRQKADEIIIKKKDAEIQALAANKELSKDDRISATAILKEEREAVVASANNYKKSVEDKIKEIKILLSGEDMEKIRSYDIKNTTSIINKMYDVGVNMLADMKTKVDTLTDLSKGVEQDEKDTKEEESVNDNAKSLTDDSNDLTNLTNDLVEKGQTFLAAIKTATAENINSLAATSSEFGAAKEAVDKKVREIKTRVDSAAELITTVKKRRIPQWRVPEDAGEDTSTWFQTFANSTIKNKIKYLREAISAYNLENSEKKIADIQGQTHTILNKLNKEQWFSVVEELMYNDGLNKAMAEESKKISEKQKKDEGLTTKAKQNRDIVQAAKQAYSDELIIEDITSKGRGGNLQEALQQIDNQKLPAGSRAFLEEYGNYIVLNAQIAKAPVQAYITDVLNVISLGQFEKAKKSISVDKMYHTWLELELAKSIDDVAGSISVIVEKNQRVYIGARYPESAEYLQSVPGLWGKSLIDLIDGAVEVLRGKGLGPFNYDATNNNCQVFIKSILDSAGATTAETDEFLIQNTTELFNRIQPWITDLTRGLVGIAQFGAVLFGKGVGGAGVSDMYGGKKRRKSVKALKKMTRRNNYV